MPKWNWIDVKYSQMLDENEAMNSLLIERDEEIQKLKERLQKQKLQEQKLKETIFKLSGEK